MLILSPYSDFYGILVVFSKIELIVERELNPTLLFAFNSARVVFVSVNCPAGVLPKVFNLYLVLAAVQYLEFGSAAIKNKTGT